jgi:hypothetical protein
MQLEKLESPTKPGSDQDYTGHPAYDPETDSFILDKDHAEAFPDPTLVAAASSRREGPQTRKKAPSLKSSPRRTAARRTR